MKEKEKREDINEKEARKREGKKALYFIFFLVSQFFFKEAL